MFKTKFVVLVILLPAISYAGVVRFQVTPDSKMAFSLAPLNANSLTKAEKQYLLDLNNEFRRKLALGQSVGAGGKMIPKASNMMALQWDSSLANYAQLQANVCPMEHPNIGTAPSPYRESGVAENIQGRIEKFETDMYGEVQYRDFEAGTCTGTCGHYIASMTWSVSRVGCAYKACSTHDVVVCEYAGRYATQGTGWNHREIRPGEPCTHCPKGYDYCLDGALCATKEWCDKSERSTCQCLVKEEACSINGEFDRANCRCVCKPGFMGSNCEETCKDEDPGWCYNQLQTSPCTVSQAHETWLCPKTCGKCEKNYNTSTAYDFWINQYPALTEGLTVNAKTTSFTFDPQSVTQLPNYGKCKNTWPDKVCEYARTHGYCKSPSRYAKMIMAGNCNLSCNTCSAQQENAISANGQLQEVAVDSSGNAKPQDNDVSSLLKELGW